MLNQKYGTNYTVVAFGGNPTSFAELRFPPNHGESRLSECFACHKPGAENPSSMQSTESMVATPQYPINPMMPTTNAFYGCHDSNAMLSHAMTNTTAL